jgi:hypothetical protein
MLSGLHFQFPPTMGRRAMIAWTRLNASPGNEVPVQQQTRTPVEYSESTVYFLMYVFMRVSIHVFMHL